MQRVRIGLTGLACVFLLVLFAAAMFGLAGEDPAASGDPANGAVQTVGDAATPKEPLAELGVAPGNAPETTNSTQPLPPVGRN